MTSSCRLSCWHARRPNTRVAASRLITGGVISVVKLSRTQTQCYGSKGSIETDIIETSVAASAPHRVQYSAGAYTSAGVDVLNFGVLSPQMVPARWQINAVRAIALPRSAIRWSRYDRFLSRLHSKVGRYSLTGKSPTTDFHIQFSFCLSVVQVKCCPHCFGFTYYEPPLFFSQDDRIDISWFHVSSIVFQSR